MGNCMCEHSNGCSNKTTTPQQQKNYTHTNGKLWSPHPPPPLHHRLCKCSTGSPYSTRMLLFCMLPCCNEFLPLERNPLLFEQFGGVWVVEQAIVYNFKCLVMFFYFVGCTCSSKICLYFWCEGCWWWWFSLLTPVGDYMKSHDPPCFFSLSFSHAHTRHLDIMRVKSYGCCSISECIAPVAYQALCLCPVAVQDCSEDGILKGLSKCNVVLPYCFLDVESLFELLSHCQVRITHVLER